MRNIAPGLSDIISLGNGISERDESIYSLEEEEKMFQINESVRNLLNSLEKNDKVVEQKDEDQT
jgi:hypothetical protein